MELAVEDIFYFVWHMATSLLFTPERWQKCHAKIMCLRWGAIPVMGRSLECSPDDLTAWYLQAGEVQVKTSREAFTARTGQWLFLGSGYRKQEFSPDAQIFSVVFNARWKDSLRPVLDLRPGFILSEIDAGLRAAMVDIRKRRGDPLDYEWHFKLTHCDFSEFLDMDSWFYGWLDKAVGLWTQHLPNLLTSGEVDSRVEAARLWVLSQPQMLPIVDFYGAAVAAGLSFGHLNRLFQEYYHQSLYGFQEQRRLQYARHRLLEPNSRIKAVAYEMGFCDLSKFSNWFKRLEQLSPRDYRKKFMLV